MKDFDLFRFKSFIFLFRTFPIKGNLIYFDLNQSFDFNFFLNLIEIKYSSHSLEIILFID